MKTLFFNLLVFATMILIQSCCALTTTRTPVNGTETSYVYFGKNDTGITSLITLFNNGEFVYSETGFEILGELCQYNRGTWNNEGDTVYLSTYFQNKIDDYIVDIGDNICADSITIVFHSLQTGKPSDDYAFLNGKNDIILPNAKGVLCIPCSDKELLTRQLLAESDNNMNVILNCGKKYYYYIKDCFPTIMHEKKFVMADSGLLDIEENVLYYRIK